MSEPQPQPHPLLLAIHPANQATDEEIAELHDLVPELARVLSGNEHPLPEGAVRREIHKVGISPRHRELARERRKLGVDKPAKPASEIRTVGPPRASAS